MTFSIDTILPGGGAGRKNGLASKREFQRRVRRLERKRRNGPLTRGYLITNNHDGMAVAHVRRVRPVSPLRGLLVVALAVVVLKAAAMAWMGPADYDLGVARLANGTVPEQMAAFVMRPDPLSAVLAAQVPALID